MAGACCTALGSAARVEALGDHDNSVFFSVVLRCNQLWPDLEERCREESMTMTCTWSEAGKALPALTGEESSSARSVRS